MGSEKANRAGNSRGAARHTRQRAAGGARRAGGSHRAGNAGNGRYAAYARYSTDKQKEASIADQLADARRHIEACGGELSEELTFTDAAVSGTSTARRGFKALTAALKLGAFDVLVVEHLDRISRDHIALFEFTEACEAAGVSIVNTHGALQFEPGASLYAHGVQALASAQFIKDLSAKTSRGMRGAFDAGKSTGGSAFGYYTDDDNTRRIDQDEAAHVLAIFKRYADGVSQAVIAKELNARGIETKRGKRWGKTSIRAILVNELYAGRVIFNRYKWTRDRETGKRSSVENPRSEWLENECPELRIIPPALWSTVAADFAKRKRDHKAGKRPKSYSQHMLSGMLTCSVCGGSMVASSGGRYFECTAHRDGRGCSNARALRAVDHASAIVDHVEAAFSGAALAEAKALHRKLKAGGGAAAQSQIKHLQTAIRKADAKADTLIDTASEMRKGAGRTKALAKADQSAIQADELRAELATLKAQAQVKIAPFPAPAKLAQIVAKLRQAIEPGQCPPEVRAMLQRLIPRGIVATPPAASGQAHALAFDFLPMVLCFPAETAPRQNRGAESSSKRCGDRICSLGEWAINARISA